MGNDLVENKQRPLALLNTVLIFINHINNTKHCAP